MRTSSGRVLIVQAHVGVHGQGLQVTFSSDARGQGEEWKWRSLATVGQRVVLKHEVAALPGMEAAPEG